MPIETRYFCSGSCGAVVTQEEYDKGLTKCGDEACTRHGDPFEQGLYCSSCEQKISEGEQKDHDH